MEEWIRQIPCLIFSSEEGILQSANQMTCLQLGYAEEQLLGKKADAIFTLPTRIFQQTHLFPLLRMQGCAQEIFITLQTKNGEHLPVLVNVAQSTINGKTVTAYAGIVVHNRKKFEDELVAAKKAAESALNENTLLKKTKQQLKEHAEMLDAQMFLVNKQNDELRQFSRVVTHDLQEPMRKMLVFSNMILENSDEQTQRKTVGHIQKVAEQMRSILSGLQQFIWLTDAVIKREKLDLEKLLLLVKQNLEQMHQGITLSIVLEEPVEIEGDREQLIFLLQELLSNAIRFRKTETEVVVCISASRIVLNKFKNIADRYEYAEHTRIQVRDEGVGFDDLYKEQVFELFKRLHSEAGQGVGLSLCKIIVENHQGSISLESTKNIGTTVVILLPNLLADEPSAEEKPEKHTQQVITHDK